ncbi:response regulator transcription factor [Paenibacillus sp. UNC451MF]|uniref:response regulator transcription factor n=1 Tax=Paenibacillus sp. UNC451MF TaxID=1449063 RepID=UPI00048CFC30|nr:response regulator [Paenibacillus sp. UNC451MF]
MLNGNVLIVEDQPNFRKGLARMVEEGKLGWSVVGEAGNGQDALELLDQVKPDLVLTDIRMPLMDGIEFVGRLRQRYPDMLVIILTAYKHFEYAQAAVRHGALDFLIKPCTEEDVRQVLVKASERFYEQYAQRQNRKLQQKLEQDQTLRSALLDLPYTPQDAQCLNDLLEGTELWQLQLDNADLAKKQYGKSDLSLIQFALSNIIEELLRGEGQHARLILIEHDRFVLVSQQQRLEDGVREAIQASALQYLNIHLHWMRMGMAPKVEQLAVLYAGAKGAASGKSEFSEVQSNEAGATTSLSLSQARVKELEVQLMSAIMTGQADQLQQLLDRMLEELQSQTPDEMKLYALTLSIAMHSTVQTQFETDEAAVLTGVPYDMPQSHWSPEEVLNWAKEQVRSFILLFNNWQASKSDNLIERAVKYIEEHYSEECRLTDVASHIHLNPSYFSVLFKKSTGESFTRYVTRIRMDKAALLLRNTDMKIFEIACAVGFDEPNYFTNVFRQQFQMSPKEYRKVP